jgi:eukaryotic-like serine/threonine-protein kinase
MVDFDKLVRYEVRPGKPIKAGQGLIWRAKDLLIGDEVAIKEIQIDLDSDPLLTPDLLAEKKQQFWREARVGARLGPECPNIVTIRDYGQVDGIPYFAMEWIDGGNLSGQSGRMSLQRAKGMLRQVSNAVKTAHQHGIVHSDIAPWNILYDSTVNYCKLTDFGFLKVLDSILISSGAGIAGGRRPFMPPEHWQMPENINKSTDIYALAHTFYILLTGEQLVFGKEGKLKIPGVIYIKHESRSAPDEVRQLLNRFIAGRQEKDSVEDFLSYLDRIP